MEAKPWFWTRTMMTFSPSETMVTISWAIIRYEPSPTRTTTSREGSAIFAPTPAATS